MTPDAINHPAQTFATGAVREIKPGKPRLDLISPFMLERLGRILEKNIKSDRGERNWEKGYPNSICIASHDRHVNQYKIYGTRRDAQGNIIGDDHLAAALCNIMFMIHNEEMIHHGKLPASLDDMPIYLAEKEGSAKC